MKKLLLIALAGWVALLLPVLHANGANTPHTQVSSVYLGPPYSMYYDLFFGPGSAAGAVTTANYLNYSASASAEYGHLSAHAYANAANPYATNDSVNLGVASIKTTAYTWDRITITTPTLVSCYVCFSFRVTGTLFVSNPANSSMASMAWYGGSAWTTSAASPSRSIDSTQTNCYSFFSGEPFDVTFGLEVEAADRGAMANSFAASDFSGSAALTSIAVFDDAYNPITEYTFAAASGATYGLGAAPAPQAVGVFRPSDGTFYLDANKNGVWDGCGTDKCLQIGMAGDGALVGDWNGSGTTKVGVFRPSDGTFYLDYNGNGQWDGCGTDRCLQIGMDGDLPLVGDWNGSGTSKVGAFRPTDGTFYLDYNGSGTWDGCGTDRCLAIGMNGDMPLVGDWNASRTAKVGVFRPSDGTFYLDYTGNGTWDGCGVDRCVQLGLVNDTPLVGDRYGTGTSKVGVFRPSEGTLYFDFNGSGTWEGCEVDRCVPIGLAGDAPLVGDWDGSGTSKVGVFRPSDGTFYLDYNGNGQWDGCETDRCLQIGMSGDTPLVGKW